MKNVPVEVEWNLKNVASMANTCYNIIHVTYFGKTREEKVKTSKLLHEELYESNYLEYPQYSNDGFEDENELITEFELESKWVAPLQFLQHLCNKYNIDIIGVAYEFGCGYVESFELKNQLIEEEIQIQHIIPFVEFQGDVETITELPDTQNEDILDSEYPTPDSLDLSDTEILKSLQ